ncbi:MAG: hypothetical protein Q8M94_19680 [Ignavibacteria bacterium]|nr:hypothetical protein [Ignavibacteria bacterium]
MTEKPMTEKGRAHMFFKRHKAGMKLAEDEMKLMIKYYGYLLFVRVMVIPDNLNG